jgi:HSP20 family protein
MPFKEDTIMNVARWDPFRELVTLSDRLNRALSDTTGPYGTSSYGSWSPPVDIYERQDGLVIRAEIPGVNKDEIDIRLENNILTLHGERRREEGFDETAAHRLERVFGTFTRSFSLPTSVDSGKISAAYRDGVLEITLPKAEEAKPKRIQIRSS